MGVMRYIAGNLIDSTAVITASTEDATYLRAYLYNRRAGKPFKFTTVSGDLVIDLGEAKAVTAIAIMGHNFTSGATITLYGNATDAWGAPSKTETLTWRDKDLYKCFASGSYRYWKLVVSDGGNSSNLKIGELILGTHTELSQNYNWGRSDTDEYINLVDLTEYQQAWVYELTEQKKFTLGFFVDDTTRAEIITWHTAVKGKLYPFVFIPDSAEADCYYMRLGNKLERSLQFTNQNIFRTVQLIEEPEGKDI